MAPGDVTVLTRRGAPSSSWSLAGVRWPAPAGRHVRSDACPIRSPTRSRPARVPAAVLHAELAAVRAEPRRRRTAAVRFQAAYRDEAGDVQQTAWVNWTDVELDLVRHRVVGGRAGYVTNKLVESLSRSYRPMTDEQRTVLNVTRDDVAPLSWDDLADQLATRRRPAEAARRVPAVRTRHGATGHGRRRRPVPRRATSWPCGTPSRCTRSRGTANERRSEAEQRGRPTQSHRALLRVARPGRGLWRTSARSSPISMRGTDEQPRAACRAVADGARSTRCTASRSPG